MSKLNSGETDAGFPLSSAKDQELALLYRQIELKEGECLELRRECSLLKRENRALSEQLEKVRHLVFDALKET